MFGFRRGTLLPLVISLVVCPLHLIASGQQASAEGLFNFLFGNGKQSSTPRSQALVYAPPGAVKTLSPTTQSGIGRSESYCVRLCDGRFFPIQRTGTAGSIQLCSSFCPASRTKVFQGREITYAIAVDGGRYSDLENAFVYRKRIVSNCSCNGNEGIGLAAIDVDADPTLRPGDLVATADGHVTVTDTRTSRIAAQNSRQQ